MNLILSNQILTAILVVGIAWLIIQIREVLIALFVSYVLMAAISPYVDFLRKNRVPKPIAVIVPYIVAIAGLLLILVTVVPFFIIQVQILLSRLPYYMNTELIFLGSKIDPSKIGVFATNELENIGRSIISITSRVFGGIVSAISIFAVSFYLLLYKDTLTKSFVGIFPRPYQEKIEKTTRLSEEKLGSWLRGQILLSGFIGIFTWIALTLLGVEFALPLAVLAGVLEIIPTIGPIISAIPAIIVTLTVSPLLATVVALSYFLIQLVENNILVPRIMGKAVGLNPIVIIISIIIGGKLLGVAGALLAIPFVSLLFVVYKNLD